MKHQPELLERVYRFSLAVLKFYRKLRGRAFLFSTFHFQNSLDRRSPQRIRQALLLVEHLVRNAGTE